MVFKERDMEAVCIFLFNRSSKHLKHQRVNISIALANGFKWCVARECALLSPGDGA